MLADWHEIYNFWFGEPGSPEHGAIREFWFRGGPELDHEIRERFEQDYEHAARHAFADWKDSARSCVALIILVDQFPRNMYRGEGRAFAADAVALDAAHHLVFGPLHAGLLPVERLFAYLPFEHSERIEDQDVSVRLFRSMEDHEKKAEWVDYAEQHRDLIKKFGRFPHRNELLGRASTAEELAWLESSDQRFGTAPE